ncbi:hypothetical protein KO481_35685 [Nocardia sp. NEAU-G5]|uniref:Uncharacterized protein n=1 Tax=Nocardia albiluteola TaxID=2842303 RepID=A0ABS6B9A5_9NOCA|nr:hypothetical protein [Nocardia albiluteola]MBU3066849.1 hypothetical protein [Nocardia albiluteola]
MSPALIRTVRALALTRGPISARSLAGSYRTGPTIAALSWLITKGFVESGTSHVSGRHQRPEPVYWLTTEGTQLHRQLRAAETRGQQRDTPSRKSTQVDWVSSGFVRHL